MVSCCFAVAQVSLEDVGTDVEFVAPDARVGARCRCGEEFVGIDETLRCPPVSEQLVLCAAISVSEERVT